MTPEPAEIRSWMSAARAHNETVEQHFGPVRGTALQPVLVKRCTGKHGKGRPALAKIFETSAGWLFVSRIEWLASDHLNLRPWQRRELLANFHVPEDDQALVQWVEHLDRWTQGLSATGPRWLVDAGDFWIHDDLLLTESEEVRPELWVRCVDHPAAATRLDRGDLIAEVRDAVQRKRRAKVK